jgi:hypothetical protein
MKAIFAALAVMFLLPFNGLLFLLTVYFSRDVVTMASGTFDIVDYIHLACQWVTVAALIYLMVILIRYLARRI